MVRSESVPVFRVSMICFPGEIWVAKVRQISEDMFCYFCNKYIACGYSLELSQQDSSSEYTQQVTYLLLSNKNYPKL